MVRDALNGTPKMSTVSALNSFVLFVFLWRKKKSLFTCRAASGGRIRRATTSDIIFFVVFLLLRRRSMIKLHWRRLCHLCLKSHLVVIGSSPTSSTWAQNESRATMANFDFFAHLVFQILYNFVLDTLCRHVHFDDNVYIYTLMDTSVKVDVFKKKRLFKKKIVHSYISYTRTHSDIVVDMKLCMVGISKR